MASCVCEGHSWGVLGEAELQLGAAGCGVEFASGFRSSVSTHCLQGKKLLLPILMDVLHNMFTTVEEAIALRPLSGLVPCQKGSHRTVTSAQMSLEGRMLQPAVPQGVWESCCQPVQGHQCFPDSIPKGWRRSSPRAWSTGSHWERGCS